MAEVIVDVPMNRIIRCCNYERNSKYCDPVVRCKDCIYRITSKWIDGTYMYSCIIHQNSFEVEPYDFCSWGEEKDGK